MSIRALWQPLLPLILVALLESGCELPTLMEADRKPSESIAGELAIGQRTFVQPISDDLREILERYKDELWPCPEWYEPIQIHEYVATSPPPKFPGDPEYWEECPVTPGHATNHNSSTGTASHLGRFTNEWDSCLDFSTLTGFFDAQLTAADGDKLNWEITATATPLPGGGLFSETTNVTFDGGTGRFANATGYAAGAGRGVPGEGENLIYVGCLAY